MNKFKELLEKAGDLQFIKKAKDYIAIHKIAVVTTAGITGVAIAAGVVTAVTLGHNSGREIAVGGETAKEDKEAIVMYHSDDDSYYDYEDFDIEAEEALLAEAEEAAEEVPEEAMEIEYNGKAVVIDVSKPVELIPVEEITVVEDTSSETMGDTVQIDQPSGGNSTENYEVNGLVYGIDVSHWQNDIDWAQVAAAGYKFAMIKVAGRSTGAEGSLYIDDYYEQNIRGALNNGIQVGVYFFSQALTVQEAYEEASLILDLIKDYRITYPVVFDWETTSGYRTCDRLDRETLTQICEAFCDTVRSHGYQPMIYMSKNDWYNKVDAARLTSKYKSWLAWYFYKYYGTGVNFTEGDSVPDVSFSYQMWQYTSTGSVPGISGNVDMNIAFFSYGGSSTKEAELVVPDTKRVYTGENFAPLSGVKGNNSIGYTMPVGFSIINSAGQVVSSMTYDEVDESESEPDDIMVSIDVAGNYTIHYEFKDPKKGIISKDRKLVAVKKEETTTSPDKDKNNETTTSGKQEETTTQPSATDKDNSETATEPTTPVTEPTTSVTGPTTSVTGPTTPTTAAESITTAGENIKSGL